MTRELSDVTGSGRGKTVLASWSGTALHLQADGLSTLVADYGRAVGEGE
jgi:hypothetical protein